MCHEGVPVGALVCGVNDKVPLIENVSITTRFMDTNCDDFVSSVYERTAISNEVQNGPKLMAMVAPPGRSWYDSRRSFFTKKQDYVNRRTGDLK
jgi:hypothetical protein